MSAWPSLDRLDDERLARDLAAGDPGALGALADRYAARLYDYCHALLRDQETAALALHDALLAAYAHAPRLRYPDRFRSWLYALVRNECVRWLRDPARPAERHEAPEVEDVFLDAGERAHRLATRRVVHGALGELRGREREALDLLMRHGLDPAEISDVLALPVQEATELVGAARARLDDALAAALIARTGRDACPSVAALAGDVDSPLPPATTRKLVRHIDTCPVCGERRDRTVSTSRLLQVLPVAMLPGEVRGHVLTTATDPEYAGDFHDAVRRAEPFDANGWPLPVDRPEAPEPRGRRLPPRLLPALAAAAVVVLLVAGAFLLMPGSGDRNAGAQSPRSSATPGDPSESAPADDPTTDDPSAPPSPSPSDDPTTEPPTPGVTPTPTPSARRTTPAPKTPRANPTRTRRRTAAPKPPASGSLAVSGCTAAAGDGGCTVTVSARGGPVTWSVTGTTGGVSASGGGTLAAGQSASVTATVDCSGGSGSGSVTFSPNGSAPVSWTCATT
ncbi:RNA polymerase sigma factor [Actinomadura parmotrematis]|uniref:Sigma-70 family RNA polymerase sigma factor n=1 Tax=Actinomadura parmotrematis TaxID=2864039 RepID=A0ABS7G156_9ACTN|nr:sigma-70 family RNA polymerase sigma factor [Actinomadura parmotrematis]MBW8486423.1 sigma-70 family RNA polymerase sigma factor [Actinomadura parmotrematis]